MPCTEERSKETMHVMACSGMQERAPSSPSPCCKLIVQGKHISSLVPLAANHGLGLLACSFRHDARRFGGQSTRIPPTNAQEGEHRGHLLPVEREVLGGHGGLI